MLSAKLLLCCAAVLLLGCACAAAPPPAGVVLAVHGGAGGLPPGGTTPEQDKAHRADLEKALREGLRHLQKSGGGSLDAVEAAVKVLEDSPLFNAGRGAVFTREGRNELDAAVMDGASGRAGAVAAVTRVKNPVSAARAVMEKSPHVLLVGDGADRFAASAGLAAVNPLYFWTDHRFKQLQDAARRARPGDDWPFGTVGAVAVDPQRRLAAATSTGGVTDKLPGRVGDSPLIGAGTFADPAVAVSATGRGEFFMRRVVAYDVACRVKYLRQSPPDAAAAALAELPPDSGGMIALDADGRLALPFNTPRMFRGWVTADGTVGVAIGRD